MSRFNGFCSGEIQVKVRNSKDSSSISDLTSTLLPNLIKFLMSFCPTKRGVFLANEQRKSPYTAYAWVETIEFHWDWVFPCTRRGSDGHAKISRETLTDFLHFRCAHPLSRDRLHFRCACPSCRKTLARLGKQDWVPDHSHQTV